MTKASTTDWEQAARAALDAKTKPLGALGRLEEIAARLAAVQQTNQPAAERVRVVVFAADHGVAAEGVSAYPPAVTAQMMKNFAAGGAAVCVLARSAGLEAEVVDVGVDADLGGLDGIVHAKVRRGTRNLLREPAMTKAECAAAMEVGHAAVRRAAAGGVQALGLGEMGIGNTTAAAALLALLTEASADEVTGRGTGVDDAGLARKQAVVAQAAERHAAAAGDPRCALAAVGGLELAACAGAALEAPRHRLPVVVDGFIATAAVLAAARMDATIRPALFFAHRSAERGHAHALKTLEARPLLDLGLRLGEGSGAALALPLLRAAAAVLRDMATFGEAGVSGKLSGEPAEDMAKDA